MMQSGLTESALCPYCGALVTCGECLCQSCGKSLPYADMDDGLIRGEREALYRLMEDVSISLRCPPKPLKYLAFPSIPDCVAFYHVPETGHFYAALETKLGRDLGRSWDAIEKSEIMHIVRTLCKSEECLSAGSMAEDDTAIDAERFCNTKSAIFIVLPEEDLTKYFMVSLMIQQLYREILSVADENGGKLDNRVIFYCDELGTIPPIESLQLIFSASRSRRLLMVPIIQSFGQLQKNYGKEGSEIIVDNCQCTIFGGFAPNSQTAEALSKALGSRTVMSGSISRGKNDPSQSLQMMERPLMMPDELKSLPKGQFIVMKTGTHPMQTRLRLFLDWGITFDRAYEVPEKAERKVAYADKDELEQRILLRFHAGKAADDLPVNAGGKRGGMAQSQSDFSLKESSRHAQKEMSHTQEVKR